MLVSNSGNPRVGLDAVPKWRIYLYLAVYAVGLGSIFIWHQYEYPAFSIWRKVIGFTIAYSIPLIFFKYLDRFSNKEYALKHLPAILRAWYVVMAIQIMFFVAKLLAVN